PGKYRGMVARAKFGRFAVGLGCAISCSLLHAQVRTDVDNGTPLNMTVESGAWIKSGTYYLYNNHNGTVSLKGRITTGDFRFEAVLRMHDFSRNPGKVLINQLGEMGLSRSGGTSQAYVRGFFFGDMTRNVGARSGMMQDDQDFLLVVERSGNTVNIHINNHLFWTTVYEADREFGKVSFRTASNGGLRIKS